MVLKIVYWATTIIAAAMLLLDVIYLTGSAQWSPLSTTLATRSISGWFSASPSRPPASSCSCRGSVC